MQLVRRGPLFDVYRDGATCLKRVSSAPREERLAALASHRSDANVTNIFTTCRFGWCGEEALPESCFESLLVAEQRVIECAAEAWNHPGARFEGGALRMPWCDALSFAELSRNEQRRCLPRMLPALWTALAFCPHGDLKPDSFLLEPGGWFRILDPGVMVGGPVQARPEPGLSTHTFLMTTNAAHYPLLTPEYGPNAPRLRAEARLVELLSNDEPFVLSPPTGAVDAPSAADALALGAIAFGILTERTIGEVLALDMPLWCGTWRDGNLPLDRSQAILAALAAGHLEGALARTDATRVEIELCSRLIRLGLDAGAVAQLAHDVMRELEGSGLR